MNLMTKLIPDKQLNNFMMIVMKTNKIIIKIISKVEIYWKVIMMKKNKDKNFNKQ